MRRRWATALTVAGAVILAGGGYLVGAETHSAADRSSCAEATRAASAFVDAWSKLDTDDERRTLKARSAADVIVQHPDCFSLAARAQGRAAADQLNQDGDTNVLRRVSGMEVCEAVGRTPYFCVAPPARP